MDSITNFRADTCPARGSPPELSSKSAKATKETNLQQLRKRIANSKAGDFFDSAHEAIVSWLSPYSWPNQTGYTYSLQETTEAGTPTYRAYLSLSLPSPTGPAILTLQDRAPAAASAVWSEIESAWADRLTKRKGYTEVRVSSASEWAAMRDSVHRLCNAILEARRRAREAEAKASADVGAGDEA